MKWLLYLSNKYCIRKEAVTRCGSFFFLAQLHIVGVMPPKISLLTFGRDSP